MDVNISYYSTNRSLLILIGHWPHDHSIAKPIRRIIFSLLMTSFISVQICKFFTTELTVDLFIEIIPPLFFCLICAVKYVTYWIIDSFLEDVLDRVHSEWNSLTETSEIEILKEAAKDGQLYGLCITYCCFSGTLIFVSLQYIPVILDIVASLNESRPNYHPFTAEYFVDSETYFYPILVHMQISVILAITIAVSTDSSNIAVTQHACGMFNIVGYRLEHLFDENIQGIGVDDDILFRRKMAGIVKYHRSIVEFMETVKDRMMLSYLIQLILVVIAVTGLLLQLHKAVSPMEDVGFVILTACRVIGHFLVIFFNILPGQRILDSSGDIPFKAYSGYWYKAPLKAQKLLLFFMQKNKEPYKVTVANIIYMKLEMFATIVQMTFSYFTVIHSMNE